MNYPTKKKSNISSLTSQSNRGMSLENDINITNETYLNEDKAIIYKKPTPIKVIKVEYKSRSTAKIVEAYYNTPSTTDYNGIYKSKYIDFEAKECHSKTAFSLSLIHPHQIKHLERCLNHGAIAFIILRMASFDKTYLIKAEDFLDFYKGESRKSLSYEWIKKHGVIIEYKYSKPCDYLEVVDKVYKL